MSTRRASVLQRFSFVASCAVSVALLLPSCGGPGAEDESESLLVSIAEGPEALGAEIAIDGAALLLAAEVGERGLEVRVFEPGGSMSMTIFRDAQGALVTLEEPLVPIVPRPEGTVHHAGAPGVDVLGEVTVAHSPVGVAETCFVARCEAVPSPVACCAEALRRTLRRADGATIVWRFAGHGLGEPSSEDVVGHPAP